MDINFFRANKAFFQTIGAIFFVVLFYFFFFNAPADFPVGTIVKIEGGLSLRSTSLKLKEAHIIRSRLAFEAFVILFGREKHVIEADYYFENKLPVFEIARRISSGEHHIAPIAVTIPEGFNVTQIADAFASKLVNFNKNKFLLEAKSLEGYLFPDTYFFLATDSEKEVIKSMSDNFEKKIAPIRHFIVSTHKTEKQIIIMASIIEGEAKGDTDRKVISGILWKRISINMPLQVDVAPETYKTKGLPKSPIGNPGLESIKASIDPKSSPYLYYLHDKDGNIHYAKTFAEHLRNISKYLK
ncbi:MAG: hypothetical protein UR90_C0010G0002 [Parcubacteria group bacterium GW2011_GWC1_35_8]|uniref:Endolytic murein transglycosylase n=3 Tax=Candidatus Nomuraibacteriota TaxID=1752729 RepID=A0A1F6YWQ8_9BACT|nr:MAG: hypothetical protein UR90_C0010G0002 [Parcubacteria group bacterium GW2011_GWC1_35_8]KKP89044.1 MAG: hypothetical protein UR91_C0007G0004 [Candidatus Nomurabacteria bacterium GW2011_GWC2_35_8]OGJ05790.1 MAG: hypothetical protein A2238_00850 [Candidatus Nomurabacteria bacterium RIFOXYA2_FULL_35_9]OGJ05956.1 MAG: hypothetical protein A2192_02825 [Candidatus Nomurabacteria bacterium RIFOXYA1_FULL_35_17]OGJ10839.1 MAG: hypothetical protein A2456_03090 [Candidatus Nomurabacteria bacterium RI